MTPLQQYLALGGRRGGIGGMAQDASDPDYRAALAAAQAIDSNAQTTWTPKGDQDNAASYNISIDPSKLPTLANGTELYQVDTQGHQMYTPIIPGWSGRPGPAGGSYLRNPQDVWSDPNYGQVTDASNINTFNPQQHSWLDYMPAAIMAIASMGALAPGALGLTAGGDAAGLGAAGIGEGMGSTFAGGLGNSLVSGAGSTLGATSAAGTTLGKLLAGNLRPGGFSNPISIGASLLGMIPGVGGVMPYLNAGGSVYNLINQQRSGTPNPMQMYSTLARLYGLTGG
jgi:hypothetical protein